MTNKIKSSEFFRLFDVRSYLAILYALRVRMDQCNENIRLALDHPDDPIYKARLAYWVNELHAVEHAYDLLP